MPMMPPEGVADIDKQATEYYQRIDALIERYRMLSEANGTAMATVVLASEFYRRTPLSDIPQLLNTLVFAIARLAERNPNPYRPPSSE